MEMSGGRHILDGGGGLHLNIYYFQIFIEPLLNVNHVFSHWHDHRLFY